ncbi:MAG: hypothetical protein IPP73_14680 [Chitinophagaceae bacterium]|nr:hypothetical protein [Chitinophagaceae bacterium]
MVLAQNLWAQCEFTIKAQLEQHNYRKPLSIKICISPVTANINFTIIDSTKESFYDFYREVYLPLKDKTTGKDSLRLLSNFIDSVELAYSFCRKDSLIIFLKEYPSYAEMIRTIINAPDSAFNNQNKYILIADGFNLYFTLQSETRYLHRSAQSPRDDRYPLFSLLLRSTIQLDRDRGEKAFLKKEETYGY